MTTAEKLSAAEVLSKLNTFTGSETLTRHWGGRVLVTEGVQWLAENTGAYWLIDTVASWQLVSEVAAETFQSWKLRLQPSGTATLTCDDGNGRIVAKQDIEFTDFPLKEIVLWCEYGTLMLPTER